MKKLLIILLILLLPLSAFAGSITRTTISDSAGTRYKITVAGWKYSGTASGGESTALYSTALTGSVEENVISTGNGVRNTFNPGNGSRTRLYDNVTGTFLTDGVMPSNLVVDTSTGQVYDSNIRGAWFEYAIWLNNTSFPTSSTAYEIHGFCKVTPTAWATSYQWNLMYIHTGTGAGQVRLIKAVTDDGTTVRLWTGSNSRWTITPDNTSQFYILYSPLDIHHESVAQGWSLTQALFDKRSQVPLIVEIAAEISVGASSTTYFGYADMYVWGSAAGGQWGWGTYAHWLMESNAIAFFGEGDYQDDIPIAKGQKAIAGGKAGSPWSNSPSGTWRLETGAEVYNSQSWGMGSGGITSTINALSYTQYNYYGIPYSPPIPARRKRNWYSGGNWDGPIQVGSETIEGVVTNRIEIDTRSQPVVAGTTVGFGLMWMSGNDGGVGDYFTEHRNSNHHIVGNYQDSGKDIDWWAFYPSGTNRYNWVEKKSITYTVTDSSSKAPLSGVVIVAENARGDVISESDSGADITANMTYDQTTMVVDLRENLKSNTLYRLDNEYILTGTVSGSGAGTLSGITRESRYPQKFRGKVHKYNTDNFDKSLYEVGGSVTTDANGQATVWFPSFSVQLDSSTAFASQVTVDGINYTCTTNHQATTGNKPPGANWSATGSEGFPWLEDKYYTTGAGNDRRSYTNLCPCPVTFTNAGYTTSIDVFEPTIDTEALNIPIGLQEAGAGGTVIYDSTLYDSVIY